VLFVLALAGACALAAPARADDAQTHFDKGNAAFQAEHYEEALVEYLAAWKLTKVYDLAAIMGQAEMRLGKYREAAEHFAYALKHFPLTGDEELRKNTEVSLGMVKKEVATVRISPSVKDATVTVDGLPLDPSQVGGEVYLSAGDHVIEATAPGFGAAKKSFKAKGGANEEIKLDLKAEAGGGGGGRSTTPAFVLGGVGVVGVILGAALVGAAEGKKSDAFKLHDEIGSPAGCAADPVKCKTLQDTTRAADGLGNGGVAAFVFGGVAGVAAAAYLLVPGRKPSKAGVSVTPSVGFGTGGVIVSGSF
jgi:tetratricopeptide (TPR) repeat protein